MHQYLKNLPQLALRVALGLFTVTLVACGGGDVTSSPTAAGGTTTTGLTGTTTAPPIVAALPTCTAAIPVAAPLRDISAIQGTGSVSPMVSQTVTVRGVVVGEFQNQTKTALNGFFIQQAVPDADPLTSEGIFVFAPTAAKVSQGDYLQVSGLVSEFGGATDSITQISGSVTVSLCGTGIAVTPTPVSLPVTTSTTLERYEGMLVEVNQTLAVTELFELGRFGQMALSLGGRQFHPNNGNVVVTNAQNLLRRIVLDDGSGMSNPNPIPYLSATGVTGTRRMGDTVPKITGVLSHNFAAYRIHPTVAPVFTNVNVRPATAPVANGTLKVASFNVLNYFTTFTNGANAAGLTGQGCTLGTGAVTASNCRGARNLSDFQRQQAKIVAAIVGLDADVVGLMEIQNTDIATQNLVDALNASAGAGTYAMVNSGVVGTDAIKVDILYKPARVKRVGGVVLPTGDDLANYTAPAGRPPLAQRFQTVANNGGFWFVVNHFKSKGSCPATGDIDLGQGCFNTGRTQQANALNSFVAKLKLQGEDDVLMMGDFNSYLLEDPIKALEAAGNESLLNRMPANDRFTYVFGGETGALDHAHASATLRSQVSSVGVWHINADEPSVLEYSTQFNTDDRFAPTPFRASDHDPVLVGLTLTGDAVVNQPILSANIGAVATAGQTYTVVIADAVAGGAATLTSLSVAWGDGTPATTTSVSGSVTHTYAAAGAFNVVITLTNSAGQTAMRSGTVTVAAAAVPPPVVTPGSQDLFFSEYVEGSSNNKAIEIYNPTAATVDLSLYTVKLYSNGTTTVSSFVTLTGTLAPGGVLVIANASATAAFKPVGSITSGVANFNGDDALTLEKSSVVIDRFGQVGFRPATAWGLGTPVASQDKTLRRKAAITTGDNNAAAVFDPSMEWDGFVIDTADGLGTR